MAAAPALASDLAHLVVEVANPLNASLQPYGAAEFQPLEEGQVRVHVAKLVVTSNTVTYALAGRYPPLNYFDHFPVPPGIDASRYARSPCWGHGVVVESRCPELAVGTRLHGFFCFSPYVVLVPTEVSPTNLVDVSPHRAELMKAYRYYRTSEEPSYKGASDDDEDFRMAAALFETGWNMSQTALLHAEKPAAIIMTSASSRTSQAAANAAKFHEMPLQVIGLTSKGNTDFVKGLGIYDVVCAYEDVASLAGPGKVAIFDVAGDAPILEALFARFGSDVVHCSSVGLAHPQAFGQQTKLPEGTAKEALPQPFLVFSASEKAKAHYGNEEAGKMLAQAFEAYAAKMRPLFKVERCYGPAGALQIFEKVARGEARPEVTYVCSLWPAEAHEPPEPKL